MLDIIAGNDKGVLLLQSWIIHGSGEGMKAGIKRAEGWYSEGISGTGEIDPEVRRSYLESGQAV